MNTPGPAPSKWHAAPICATDSLRALCLYLLNGIHQTRPASAGRGIDARGGWGESRGVEDFRRSPLAVTRRPRYGSPPRGGVHAPRSPPCIGALEPRLVCARIHPWLVALSPRRRQQHLRHLVTGSARERALQHSRISSSHRKPELPTTKGSFDLDPAGASAILTIPVKSRLNASRRAEQ